MPLKTRDGVADAPIDPGLRMLCEPCVFGPRWKLCRLIVPAKPLPCETPLTLIFSPGSNASTVTFSPTTSSLWPRSSSRCRYAPSTLFFFRWPTRGLRDLALGDLVVRDLHGVVAVRVGGLHLHDGTRLGLDHRDRA